MRRISVHRPNAKVRNPERRLRALRHWADSFAGYFPLEHANRRYANWKIPVLDRLARPPTTTAAIQTQCVQCLVDAAAHIAQAKPNGLSHARVVVILGLPDLFNSEVCVFFDEPYFQAFADRSTEWQRWTPLPKSRSLIADLGLRIPDSFFESGFAEVLRDKESGKTWKSEVWLIGECGPAR